jgi:hypothetical protein
MSTSCFLLLPCPLSLGLCFTSLQVPKPSPVFFKNPPAHPAPGEHPLSSSSSSRSSFIHSTQWPTGPDNVPRTATDAQCWPLPWGYQVWQVACAVGCNLEEKTGTSSFHPMDLKCLLWLRGVSEYPSCNSNKVAQGAQAWEMEVLGGGLLASLEESMPLAFALGHPPPLDRACLECELASAGTGSCLLRLGGLIPQST